MEIVYNACSFQRNCTIDNVYLIYVRYVTKQMFDSGIRFKERMTWSEKFQLQQGVNDDKRRNQLISYFSVFTDRGFKCLVSAMLK